VNGILLLDKPLGPTSHDLVAWARRVLGCRRIGHCGTLDPAASGLLVLAVGAGTRLVSQLTDADKSYHAVFVLGRSTDSGDAEGATVEEADVPDDAPAAALLALEQMVGALELPPPAFSAIKIAGERAHERARRGEVVELARRSMTVRSLGPRSVLSHPLGPAVDAQMTVSKGTYVRSLAVELGRRIGLPVHLGGLRRLGCGHFNLEHPQVVRPAARPQLGRSGWWIDLPGLADAEEMRQTALNGLIALDEGIDLPCATFDPNDEAGRRLLWGQSIAVSALAAPATFAALPEGGRVGLVARVRGGLSHLVIGRLTTVEGSLRVAPERVLSLTSTEEKTDSDA
jgi:tRNA pseudouridine(55) synthase